MKQALIKLCLLLGLAFPLLVAQPVVAVDVIDPICLDENGNRRTGDDLPDICEQSQAGASNEESPLTGPWGILNRVTNILSFVVGVASLVVIVISGLRFIVSAGDSNAISSARRSLLYALIGLMIAVISRIVVRFILSTLE